MRTHRIAATCSALAIAVACNGCAAPQGPRASPAIAGKSGEQVLPSYVASVTHAIRSNTLYGGSIPSEGNPSVTYRLELLPDGTVTAVTLQEPSGQPAFDEAVRRGILRASPLPRRANGVSELRMIIRFHMKS
ncbi:TonB C-terminal domain-containing protein [Massilia sp. Dwa41.01b]|uniref:energy transducer TonB n=1 Tax=unclassified Massilia TaxID=2609279 RepID=UPI0016040ACD|nr:TonB C-terminal domain-containing protein [Massilia sp. Dwa41.01b]QNB00096.1 TonB C-terminal domain-containing protein [Massilia sp. Se16.2.3]